MLNPTFESAIVATEQPVGDLRRDLARAIDSGEAFFAARPNMRASELVAALRAAGADANVDPRGHQIVRVLTNRENAPTIALQIVLAGAVHCEPPHG